MKRYLSALILGATSLGVTSVTSFAAAPQKILIVGDSLSAEYGLPRGAGWANLLAQKLVKEKINAEVINASISGDTTSGGLSRMPALLYAQKPNIVIIELGGNDALRGMAMAQTEKNFSRMVELATRAGAKVLLLGMQVPPNMGPAYAREFAAVYQHVAKSNKAALVPFFLKGVADVPNSRELFQPDGIHPVATAHPTMLANIWPELRKLLK